VLPDRIRALGRAALAMALLAAIAAPALAMALRVPAPRLEDGRLWVNAALDDPLDRRVQRTLQRGAPATLLLRAELWRRRGGWFDRFERSADALLRVRYLASDRLYALDRPGAGRITTASLDSLEMLLERPITMPLASEGSLEPGARYYVVVVATLKPLSVQDLAEVEAMLRGEAQEQRESGVGVITTLPRSVFDAVRNFVGFGDARARGASPDFVLPVEP
jgi:hypothetical protein